MAVTFYYVRHGQTVFNLSRRLQGWCDSPLTEKGIEDAGRAEKALRAIPFDRAYCSSSERCVDTAAIILQRHNVTAKPTKLLKEVDFGRLDGMLFDEVHEEFELRKKADDFGPVGGDTPETLRRRIFDVLYGISDLASDGERILLVSHGAYGMRVLKYMFHIDLDAFRRMQAEKLGKQYMFPNGGIMKFERRGDVWRLLELPCEPEAFRDSEEPAEYPVVRG